MGRITTLVTGFDAFGGATVNSSQLVVEALAVEQLNGVVTAVLPTSFRGADERIRELIRTYRPNRVLMLGLADRTNVILLEQTALNLDNCTMPDNEGEVRVRKCIVDGAPNQYSNSLPVRNMANTARQRGLDIEFSYDAGGFVCNHVFFTVAQVLATELPASLCGFVHLPFIGGPGRKLEQIARLIQTWIIDWHTA